MADKQSAQSLLQGEALELYSKLSALQFFFENLSPDFHPEEDTYHGISYLLRDVAKRTHRLWRALDSVSTTTLAQEFPVNWDSVDPLAALGQFLYRKSGDPNREEP